MISMIIIDILLILFIAVLIIGLTTANHMRAVSKQTLASRDEKMKTVLFDVEKNSEALKEEEAARKLKEQREAELTKANKDVDDIEARNRAIQEEDIKLDKAAATAEMVVAPKREKYIINPHKRESFYGTTNVRAYNEQSEKERFKTKFSKLTKNGYSYN